MLKRATDVIGALAGIAVLWPVLIITAVIVRIRLGSPALFRQERAGLHGARFELIKFRTMRSGSGTDDDRMTPLGQRLRALGLDELPELWNVLRGDMSLVGPRPLHVRYLDRYSDQQARRHEVRPGLTGLAQVEGRNDTTWERRLMLDVDYVDNRSWGNDLKIMVKTVRALVRRDGATTAEGSTMDEFVGVSES